MEILKLYLKQRWKGMGACLLFALIFAASFALYHLPLAAILYPALLCLLLGLLFLVVDFIHARQKHRLLAKLQNLTAAMISELPMEKGLDDRDYQAVIRTLQREVRNLKSQTNMRYQDLVDYYTLWAHQTKTPIAAMRLTLQNEDTALSRKLQAELFRIEQYVEMVLAFLRLDSTSTDYVFREHSLDTLVRQSVKKFSQEFIGRGIRLEYEPISKNVITDEKWLTFVLEQVLSNALKYTPEGSIRIYSEEPHKLCIADTGIGIAPEDLPRIFERGYTGYNGRRDKKASGIGLYLCRRVCKNLGVGITAESQVGKGTVVKLDLEQYQLRKE
jgi:signal transduction histidine kinase